MDEPTASDDTVESAGDPFAPDNLGIVQFIVQARIYDVLLALLHDANPETHNALLQAHAEGKLLGPAPFFDGEFVTNTLNATGSP